MEWALVLETTSLLSVFSASYNKKKSKKETEPETKIFLQSYEKMGLLDIKESVELDGCSGGVICTEGQLNAINCKDLTVYSFGKIKMINSQAIDVFCGEQSELFDTKISRILECAENSILRNCIVQELIIRPALRQAMTPPPLTRCRAVYLDNTIVIGDVIFHATGKIFACEKSRILGNVTNGSIIRSLKGLSKL